jgi:hypothetical protein
MTDNTTSLDQPLIDVTAPKKEETPTYVNQNSAPAQDSIYVLTDKQIGLLKDSSDRLKELKWVHVRSAQYYDKMNNYFVLPTILITSVSGMASFLSTSSVVSDDTKTIFGISVGIMASVSSLLQSMSSAYNFPTKAEMHRTAASEYDKWIVKIKHEMADPNEPEFIQSLESKLLEVQGNCKYFPPQKICDRYKPDSPM